MDDEVMKESRFSELRDCLYELKVLYPNHPVLTETEADFTDDPQRRRGLYEQALAQAASLEISSVSIRLSLAELLITDFKQPDLAMSLLETCKQELETMDPDEREKLEGLLKQATP